MERRYNMRIITIGHFGAGKTTLIKRILYDIFDMANTTSTDGIVITRKGAIRIKDGTWLHSVTSKGK